jgi:hypothetical protein
MTEQPELVRSAVPIARFIGALLVAIVPFWLSIVDYNHTLVDFYAPFVVCGVLGGLIGGFGAVPAAVIACALAILYAARTGLLAGDGAMFLYFAAIPGSGSYCVAAVIAEVLRRKGYLPSFWWRERPRDD